MMRGRTLVALVLTTGLLGVAGVPAGAGTEGGSPAALGLYGAGRSFDETGTEVLVRFEPGASSSRRAAARTKAGVRRVRASRVPGWEVVEVETGSADEAAERLADQPGVDIAEPAGIAWALDTTPNDEFFFNQWALHNSGQVYAIEGQSTEIQGTPDADVDAPNGWDTETGDPSVVVAVIDTGILPTHPEFSGQLWTNPDEVLNGLDDDGNGYADDVNGWDWYANPNDNDPSDPSAQPHGSHVAGILGARTNDGIGPNDGTGIAGVAWEVSIMPLRVLGGSQGTGSAADIVDAMQYAVDEGADVVNMSLGSGGATAAMQDVLDSAPDTAFVVAAGNEDNDNDSSRVINGKTILVHPTYPCNFDNANVICVAATTDDDDLASFSNYGSTSVDLGAPGELILSAWSDGVAGWTDDDWVFLDGTSMATPMVSGAAALLLAADPTATVAELREALLDSGDPLAALSGKTVTGRRLNVASAMTWLLDPPTFDDVLPSSSYYTYVQAIAREGITQGCSSEPPLYCPARPVTRGQMAVFLVRAMNEDGNLQEYRGLFDDVPISSPFALYIERLYDLGITNGCSTSPRRYCPGGNVTRAQMAVFLIRALLEEGNLAEYQASFSDVPESSPYALHIERLFDLEITNGCGPQLYCPGSSVTRGQMAIFIARAWDLVP